MPKGVGVLLTAIAAGAGAGGYFLWNKFRPGKVKPLCDGVSAEEIGCCMATGTSIKEMAEEFAMDVKDMLVTVQDRLSNNFEIVEKSFITTLEDVMADNREYTVGSFIDAPALMEWLGNPYRGYDILSSCLCINWTDDDVDSDEEWAGAPSCLRDADPEFAKAALKKYVKKCIDENTDGQFIYTDEWCHNVWTVWYNTPSKHFFAASTLGGRSLGCLNGSRGDCAILIHYTKKDNTTEGPEEGIVFEDEEGYYSTGDNVNTLQNDRDVVWTSSGLQKYLDQLNKYLRSGELDKVVEYAEKYPQLRRVVEKIMEYDEKGYSTEIRLLPYDRFS